MKVGVADYGMNVWEGACQDTERRLADLKAIGYEGIERLQATSGDDALYKAARFRALGMDFVTCLGPSPEVSLRWTASFGKGYIWTNSQATEFDVFCRQVNRQVEICADWNVKVGLHNHLGTRVESQRAPLSTCGTTAGVGALAYQIARAARRAASASNPTRSHRAVTARPRHAQACHCGSTPRWLVAPTRGRAGRR